VRDRGLGARLELAGRVRVAGHAVTVTVLIADDEPEFRVALAGVVERAPGLQLVGAARDAAEAIDLACRERPAVAVVDVRMDGGGGPRVARYLRQLAPDVRVLALSAYDDQGTVAQMLEAGATGYLLKGTSARELVDAIERTAAGEEVLSAELSNSHGPLPGESVERAPRQDPEPRARPITVVLADDNPEFVETLSLIIQRDPGFDLVGKARDTTGAIRLAALYKPDLALVDWQMPGGGGAIAAAEIVRSSPETRVVALSAHGERQAVLQMLRAGASSYVVKSVTAHDLVEILRMTAAGGAALSPEVAPGVIEELVVQLARSEHRDGREAETLGRVRSVIDESAFEIVYQPIVGLAEDRVIAVEALARFETAPRRSPDVWFGDAVEVGLGVELDMAAAKKALRILPDLPAGVDLFLNVWPESIFSDRFAELMATVSPESIVLELTEHAPVQDYDRLGAVTDALRDSGFRISVDDVGAGFASLRHLLNLRPDVLKIDISLCRFIEADRARQVLAGALASLGRELGATVVAEGIETAAELQAVRDLGIDAAQGYYLGRPAAPPLNETLAATVPVPRAASR
jgi:DNA-binding NarL/FixJ family response regulator/EAL domain-containing protein (putative c-di-GMP-specific phosphodiesterase class I)